VRRVCGAEVRLSEAYREKLGIPLLQLGHDGDQPDPGDVTRAATTTS